MWQDDQPATQSESQEALSEENLELADEVYLPDYVMFDFGTRKATRNDG
jgi:hypothetical protein